MPIDWNELQKAMSPIKDYEDLRRRWREAFAYPFVREAYNLTLPEMTGYTRRLLGGDTRGRYTEYLQRLVGIFNQLHQAGVQDILDLVARADTREQVEAFTDQFGIQAKDVVAVLKYLAYWFIPMRKQLSGLVQSDSPLNAAIRALRGVGVRTNLDILQRGLTPEGRKALAEESGLPEAVIDELVNRADFSRMPWASKATISNIMGAGYGSLAELADAEPEQLYEAFYRYGASIGKNLKLGNEIDNSLRVARIVPAILETDQ